ncbi:MAG: metalloregulator ArsR/SmtB family transcription factor, partial [Candidatus Omnitrophota bacterium]
LSDDTRLRILHILNDSDLNVKEICSILGLKQPSISKHLGRLRLLGLVSDKRKGNCVHYSLNKNQSSETIKIIAFLLDEFSYLETFKKDDETIKKSYSKEVQLHMRTNSADYKSGMYG